MTAALDAATVIVNVVIDDPGAYTKPFETRVTLRQSAVPFMQAHGIARCATTRDSPRTC